MKIRIENYEIVTFTVYSLKKKPKIQKKKIQNLNSYRDKYRFEGIVTSWIDD